MAIQKVNELILDIMPSRHLLFLNVILIIYIRLQMTDRKAKLNFNQQMIWKNFVQFHKQRHDYIECNIMIFNCYKLLEIIFINSNNILDY